MTTHIERLTSAAEYLDGLPRTLSTSEALMRQQIEDSIAADEPWASMLAATRIGLEYANLDCSARYNVAPIGPTSAHAPHQPLVRFKRRSI
ncbi:MAG: hypothetical protein V4569_04445 [Pseudomonadota bacterium]